MSIYLCYDFETVNEDKHGKANKDVLDVVQVAAVPIDIKKLEILKDDAINIVMKPDDINSKTFKEDYSNVIDFHCRSLGKSAEELVEHWKMGVSQKDGLLKFIDYVNEFRDGGPVISVGQNSKKFDNYIFQRKCKEYKKRYPFKMNIEIDTIDIFNLWFMFAHNPPKNRGMDEVLKHLGMSNEGSHDALVDVMNTSEVCLRFFRLMKGLMTSNASQKWVRVLNGSDAIQ